MILSQLLLNPRHRATLRDLANPYEMHRTLMRAFPQGAGDLQRDAEASAGLLYRVETAPGSSFPRLLAQSRLRPEWSALPAGYLLEGALPAVKEFTPEFAAGQVLIFRLLANPTKRLGKSAGADQGARVGVRPAELEGWLARKAEEAGVRILSVNVANRGHEVGWVAAPSAPVGVPALAGAAVEAVAAREAVVVDAKRREARWLSVQFDGRLAVLDPARLALAVERGIGSGKAFGFGLLSLAR